MHRHHTRSSSSLLAQEMERLQRDIESLRREEMSGVSNNTDVSHTRAERLSKEAKYAKLKAEFWETRLSERRTPNPTPPSSGITPSRRTTDETERRRRRQQYPSTTTSRISIISHTSIDYEHIRRDLERYLRTLDTSSKSFVLNLQNLNKITSIIQQTNRSPFHIKKHSFQFTTEILESHPYLFEDTLSWNFNILLLNSSPEIPSENILLILCIHLIQQTWWGKKLLDDKKLSLLKLSNFLNAIENLYKKDNPYHNNLHAADVTQAVCFVMESKFFQMNFNEIECFSLYLSAIIHDTGHPGLDNYFQRITKSPLAMLYNEMSVLENYHLSEMFRIIHCSEDCDFLMNFGLDEQTKIRTNILYAVLGTDLARFHMEIKQKLKFDIDNELLKEKILSEDQKIFVLRFVLHLCDISNPYRIFQVSKFWGEMIQKEQFEQGEEMRRLGLDVPGKYDGREFMRMRKEKIAERKRKMMNGEEIFDEGELEEMRHGNFFVRNFVKPLLDCANVLMDELDVCQEILVENILLNRQIEEGLHLTDDGF